RFLVLPRWRGSTHWLWSTNRKQAATSRSLEARMSDDQDSQSPLAASGEGADRNFSDQRSGDPVKSCKDKTWVAIELKDSEGHPVAGEAYRIELPSGRTVEGTLDNLGTAGVDLTDPGDCKITFTNLHAKSWKEGSGGEPTS